MKRFPFGYYSGPLVAFGALLAIVCLGGSWYINRLQEDLARAIREDAAGMQAAGNLQVQLRNLRVHSLVLVADRTDKRREVVREDLDNVDAALEAVCQTATNPADAPLADKIRQEYQHYRSLLGLDKLPSSAGLMSDLARWSDDHHMSELLAPCRELAKRQSDRMKDSLERSAGQTAWAGRGLLLLGFAGILSGLLSGYATARTLTRRVAQLFVRVQAVQAHLDQDVGAMTIQGPPQFGDLKEQLDRVVERVSEVCQQLQKQERDLLRSEQLAAVGQLAASVAHEVRNPLTGVKLLLQAAVRSKDPITLGADRLHLLLQEVGRIERTVQELMDFSQPAAADHRSLDLCMLLEEATSVAQSRAEIKSITLRHDSSPGPMFAKVDRDRMLSLLSNLLFNAIDAAPPGGEVCVSLAPGGGGVIEATITDNGPGIDDAVAKSLFDPFVTTKANGTGLGLTVARRVAVEHGGTLTACNRPGGGACFSLTIPAVEK